MLRESMTFQRLAPPAVCYMTWETLLSVTREKTPSGDGFKAKIWSFSPSSEIMEGKLDGHRTFFVLMEMRKQSVWSRTFPS
jgi:hypothetical protein